MVSVMADIDGSPWDPESPRGQNFRNVCVEISGNNCGVKIHPGCRCCRLGGGSCSLNKMEEGSSAPAFILLPDGAMRPLTLLPPCLLCHGGLCSQTVSQNEPCPPGISFVRCFVLASRKVTYCHSRTTCTQQSSMRGTASHTKLPTFAEPESSLCPASQVLVLSLHPSRTGTWMHPCLHVPITPPKRHGARFSQKAPF